MTEKSKKEKLRTIIIDTTETLEIGTNDTRNVGYGIIKELDKQPELDMSVSYFDCTNYYFDISHPDIDELDDDSIPVDKDGNPVPCSAIKNNYNILYQKIKNLKFL